MYELVDVGVTMGAPSGRTRAILRDVQLRIGAREIVSIVGRSGTGKTTLLRVLGGLVRTTEGRAQIDGRPIDGPPETAMVVFQDYAHALLPWRTLIRNAQLGLEGRVGRRERTARASAALETVGLAGREKDYPWQLSGGMQQRLQIARALVLEPDVLLMDEPFGALDAMTRSQLQDELLRVQEQTNATVVFVTHDLEEAIYLSDRVCVIDEAPGRIIADVETRLPRPRDQLATRELPRYLEIRHRLTELLRQGAGR